MAVVQVPGIGNVHMPDEMSPDEMSQAIKGLLAQQQANGGVLPASGKIDPQQQAAPTADMAKQAAPALPTVTAGQQLSEDNNPLLKGLGATAGELVQGGSQAIGGEGILQKLLGLARVANSGGVGAGSAVGTTAHNILSNIPGLGGPEGAIPAGGAALADAATQVLAGPGIIKGVVRGTKAVGQIAPRILAPGVLRRAGGEAIAQELGAPAGVIERVFSTPASKAAYSLAEAQGPVPAGKLADVVEGAFFEHGALSNPKKQGLKYLSNLYETLSQGGPGSKVSYGQAMKEIQALKAEADSAFGGLKPNNLLGQTLMDTREKMIEALDKISSVYRQANRLYRQEQATLDIMNAVRAGTPGANLEKLIENSKDVAAAFSPKVIKEISHIATELSDVASSVPAGGFRQFIQAIAKPATDMMASEIGRAILRTTLRTPKDKLPQAIMAATQTYKAMTPKAQEPAQ